MKNSLSILICLFLANSLLQGVSIQAQTVFEINDFSAYSESLSIVGDAKLYKKYLRLTPNMPEKVGAVWYRKNKINLNSGFSTSFEFKISDKDPKFQGGDGLAFVIQNQGDDIASGLGDDIGYKKIPYAVAVEIDIFNNHEESKNHVCLSFYNPVTNKYNRYATVHDIPEVNDGKSHFARIEYADGRLIFFLDSYIFPILSVKIDLNDKIKTPDGLAYVGFTSATSLAYANHDLITWKLNEFVEPPEIDVDDRIIQSKELISVESRELKFALWDDNLIDGDTVSVRIDDKWLLTNYGVQKEKKYFNYTLTGFENELVLYAHNVGKIPPNTAALSIDDGKKKQIIILKSDMRSSESIRLKYNTKDSENFSNE